MRRIPQKRRIRVDPKAGRSKARRRRARVGIPCWRRRAPSWCRRHRLGRTPAAPSSTINTTSNSSRRDLAQGLSGRARIGDRSESLGIATTKLEKLAVSARDPFHEAMERVGQFRRRRHAISRSLCETDGQARAPVTAWGIAAVRRRRSARPQCAKSGHSRARAELLETTPFVDVLGGDTCSAPAAASPGTQVQIADKSFAAAWLRIKRGGVRN